MLLFSQNIFIQSYL